MFRFAKSNPLGLQSGFTLLEALVAVLVLSLGLLGVAGMQLKALQSSHVSYHRSVANLAAQDAVERLWGALLLSDDNTCTTSSEFDSSEDWHDYWSSRLPGLVGSPVTASSCSYVIEVRWQEERFEGEGDISVLRYFVKLPGSGA